MFFFIFEGWEIISRCDGAVHRLAGSLIMCDAFKAVPK